MIILAKILIYVYSALMMVSAIGGYINGLIPIILCFFNLLVSGLLLFSFKNKILFYIGLIGVLIASMINGMMMNHKINIIHLIIRLLISIALLYSYQKAVNK